MQDSSVFKPSSILVNLLYEVNYPQYAAFGSRIYLILASLTFWVACHGESNSSKDHKKWHWASREKILASKLA